jgi:hypothetical protein
MIDGIILGAVGCTVSRKIEGEMRDARIRL